MVANSHVTWNSQSECFISAYTNSFSTLKIVYDLGSRAPPFLFRVMIKLTLNERLRILILILSFSLSLSIVIVVAGVSLCFCTILTLVEVSSNTSEED